MKLPASAPSSAAAEEAALWAARLDGDPLDGARRAELDAWLARDPRHRALLSGYCQFSADLETQLPALVVGGVVKMPAVAAPTRRPPVFLRWSGVGLAAAAVVALAVWIARPVAEVQNLATAVAQRGTHVLADGTRVELNARTSLRFEHTGAERHVQLGDGEAVFTVAKDATRPFIVRTPTGFVRVTGTTFSVRNDPAAAVSLEVLVIEGSVQVRPSDPTGTQSGAPFSLQAGDRLAAGSRGVEVRALTNSAIENALAWREGYAVFDDVPLHEATACFARYHGRRIVVAPEVAGQRLGGFYRLDDLRAFIAGLESTNLPLPVTVTEDLSGTLTVGRR